MAAPKNPNTAPATAAARRKAQERKAAELRAVGWTVIPPEDADKARTGTVAAEDVDRSTRRLLHTSQHNQCVIWMAGRIQDDINELRTTAGLLEFGWNDAVPDEEVGRCSVHPVDCVGQHTHNPPVLGILRTT